MLNSLLSIDQAVFRSINQGLAHGPLDVLMPWLSSNPVFIPALLVAVAALLWKGNLRTRIFIAVTAIVLALGETLVVNTLKETFARPRPFMTLSDVRLLVGRGGSGSFPSSHTSLWFATATLTWLFYRRAGLVLFALASLIGFSRVYVGVHYPSDVLGGALIGFAYAVSGLLLVNQVWKLLVTRLFPEIQPRLPSLLPSQIPATLTPSTQQPTQPWTDSSWLRLGYLLIGLILALRFGYLAMEKIGLSEDEAYQWLWSKHLALSYYSKPPMIALLQWTGTHIWGDTVFGVRFCSPILAALLSTVLLRFFAREVSAKFAVGLLVILAAVPMLAVGSTLMTVDPPLVFFWMCALCLFWRAIQPDGQMSHWCLAGLCSGLATLSKYAGLYQWICLSLFLALTPPYRRVFAKPGFWVAALITLLCQIPVFVWNAQHHWITVLHVRDNATRTNTWEFSTRFFWDFVAAQAGLFNPVFFVAIIAAMIGFRSLKPRQPLLPFLFWMGAPVFLGYAAFTVYKRVFPNWVAPSIVPLISFAWLYWHERWKDGARWIKPVFISGIALGLVAVVLVHDTRLIGKISGHSIPSELDPHRRVLGWPETARLIEQHRVDLAKEGKETFVIGTHYGMVGQVTFWTPAARHALDSKALVYFRTATIPQNQFYFWPGYPQERKGQNAILVQELDGPNPDLNVQPPAQLPSEIVQNEFKSIQNIGIFPIEHRGRILRWVQLFACRELL